MLYVVGLGNPGPKYRGTRHNVGFDAVDTLAGRHGFSGERSFKQSMICRSSIRGEEVLLVKPMTYMNRSGDAVGALMHYYRGEVGKLIVVHDDLDFEPGMVRVKSGGGHGGHNGLESIISHVGRDFARVRIGIGKPASALLGADHVLTGFDDETREAIDDAIEKAADAVEAIIDEGIARAMNRFNQRPKKDDEEENEPPTKEEAAPTGSGTGDSPTN